MWRSQTFENTELNGLMLALPYELLSGWKCDDEVYDELCEREGPFDFYPVGAGFGVFISGPDDIIHEAYWVRSASQPGLILAAWNDWEGNREEWLKAQLSRTDLVWNRHPQPMTIESGVLFLLHAEGPASKARLAPPGKRAKCGQAVPVGIAPGEYYVEILELEERPEKMNCCELCRWIPAPALNLG